MPVSALWIFRWCRVLSILAWLQVLAWLQQCQGVPLLVPSASRCAEALFHPSLTDAEASGFHDTSLQSNMKCDVYVRKELYAMSCCHVARPPSSKHRLRIFTDEFPGISLLSPNASFAQSTQRTRFGRKTWPARLMSTSCHAARRQSGGFHLPALSAELTVLTREQADSIVVKLKLPFKPFRSSEVQSMVLLCLLCLYRCQG